MLLQKVRNRLTYIRNRQAIRRHDAAVNHEAWSGADFHEDYFRPFPLPPPSGQFRNGACRELTIDRQVATFAAEIITDFKAQIVGFLGPSVRLDDIYLFHYDPAERGKQWSYSNSWHDDNVGHRLKVYACFEGDGTTPTVVVPNSYNKPYSRRKTERLRFWGVRDTKPRRNEVRLPHKAGSVGIFDTSCLHRGLYEEPASRRVTLVMEFIDRGKGNAIAGSVPCAPGMSLTGRIFFKSGAYEALSQTGLLDETLTARECEGYSYSLANNPRLTTATAPATAARVLEVPNSRDRHQEHRHATEEHAENKNPAAEVAKRRIAAH